MPSRLCLAASAVALLAAAPPPIDPAVKARIDRILKATPLIDGHNDLPGAIDGDFGGSVAGLERGGAQRTPELHTDIERLRAGRVGGQFWSVYIDGNYVGDEAIRRTLDRIDVVDRLIAAYPQTFERALTADDMVRIHKAGRIGSLIGVEGGRQMGGSFAALRQYHRLGARYMTLTHNQTTEWADSATDESKWGGLSPFGEVVVREMNRLGMLVDLSHVSPETMRDALRLSRAPVIFSHSSAGGLSSHPRNVPDEILRLLPANGGVVMVNFVPGFLSKDVWDWSARRSGEEARLKAIHRASKAAVEAGVKAWDAANPRPATTVATIADHVEHVARVAGKRHVGLGADFDGIPYSVDGVTGVDAYPLVFAELIRRGWRDADLAALAGGNILDALRGAEATARAMRTVAPAMDKLPDRSSK